MKRNKNATAILMAAAMLLAGTDAMAASAETDSTWQYENCGTYIMITGGDTTAATLEIPAEIDGLPVTHIDGMAFELYENLQAVVLPDSVTTIGTAAFSQCENLVTVILSDTLTEIPNSAFYGCKNLSNITLPETVTRIGNSAFFGCTALQEIIIPDGVEEIDYAAFMSCESLEEVAIPEGITTAGRYMFDDCTALTTVTIPSTMVTIASYAFTDCDSLTSVYYNGNAAEWSVITIEDYNEPLLQATKYFADGTTDDGGTWNPDGGSLDLMLGDLSGDGQINAMDATLTLQFAAAKGAGSPLTLLEFLQDKGFRTE